MIIPISNRKNNMFKKRTAANQGLRNALSLNTNKLLQINEPCEFTKQDVNQFRQTTNYPEMLVKKLAEDIRQKEDSVFLKALELKGYFFCKFPDRSHYIHINIFIKKWCRAEKFLLTNTTIYYVFEEPFLLIKHKEPIINLTLGNRKNTITAQYSGYKFL